MCLLSKKPASCLGYHWATDRFQLALRTRQWPRIFCLAVELFEEAAIDSLILMGIRVDVFVFLCDAGPRVFGMAAYPQVCPSFPPRGSFPL